MTFPCPTRFLLCLFLFTRKLLLCAMLTNKLTVWVCPKDVEHVGQIKRMQLLVPVEICQISANCRSTPYEPERCYVLLCLRES